MLHQTSKTVRLFLAVFVTFSAIFGLIASPKVAFAEKGKIIDVEVNDRQYFVEVSCPNNKGFDTQISYDSELFAESITPIIYGNIPIDSFQSNYHSFIVKLRCANETWQDATVYSKCIWVNANERYGGIYGENGNFLGCDPTQQTQNNNSGRAPRSSPEFTYDPSYTPTPFMQNQCTMPNIVAVGGKGKVSPGSPNHLYANHSLGADTTTLIPVGATFDIVDGPVCVYTYFTPYKWWQVSYQGQTGWMVEGNSRSYWIDPATAGQ